MHLTNNEWKKPDPEVYILYDSTIKFKNKQTHTSLVLEARRVARAGAMTAEYTRGFWGSRNVLFLSLGTGYTGVLTL